MASWLFPDVELQDGETLVLRRVCLLKQGRRTIGGEVNVTDRRLLFVPNRLEQLVRARRIDLPLAEVDSVVVTPPPPGSERFAALPWTPKARAEIDIGDETVILQFEDAAVLAQVLGPQH